MFLWRYVKGCKSLSINLYCLAIQASFYSDVVECPAITQETQIRIWAGNIEDFMRYFKSL